ncbi:MAG: asparagine synthetase A [Candidatus Aenigmatarchaeota archaeon]
MELSNLNSIKSIKYRHITLKHPKMVAMLKIQDEILSAIREFLRKQGFIEILAPIIGPATDPGIRGAKQVMIDFYGQKFRLMSSMILYKQMAISSVTKIFSLSPNIRIEPKKSAKTGRHLAEFRQIDLEEAYATYEDSMHLAEKMIVYVVKDVKKKCFKELEIFSRKIKVPKTPFKRLTHEQAVEVVRKLGFKMGENEEIPWEAEEALSAQHSEPFWITDYPLKARGFYYLEDPKTNKLRDFDLILPEGFGEVISGGEREHEYKKVVDRMKKSGEDPKKYKWYLSMLKAGVPPSSGFGIGVERLTRWICGLEKIWEAVPFPKVPGIASP